jgi:hypothetical protein
MVFIVSLMCLRVHLEMKLLMVYIITVFYYLLMPVRVCDQGGVLYYNHVYYRLMPVRVCDQGDVFYYNHVYYRLMPVRVCDKGWLIFYYNYVYYWLIFSAAGIKNNVKVVSLPLRMDLLCFVRVLRVHL